MDKFPKKQDEAPKVEKSSKEFLILVNAFHVFVVQQGEAMTRNQKIAKLMNRIVKGLGAIGCAPSGGSTKVTIRAMLDSFVKK